MHLASWLSTQNRLLMHPILFWSEKMKKKGCEKEVRLTLLPDENGFRRRLVHRGRYKFHQQDSPQGAPAPSWPFLICPQIICLHIIRTKIKFMMMKIKVRQEPPTSMIEKGWLHTYELTSITVKQLLKPQTVFYGLRWEATNWCRKSITWSLVKESLNCSNSPCHHSS